LLLSLVTGISEMQHCQAFDSTLTLNVHVELLVTVY